MANTQKAPASPGAISSFAHLAGALAAKADNDKDEKDDKEDRKKEEEGEEDGGDAKKSKKAKAEMEEDAACDEGDDEPQKKGKKAKAAKEKDTSDDDGDWSDDKAQHARHEERARIHAIMTCKGAKHALREAEWLAFNTDTPASEAIGNLNVMAIEKLSEAALVAKEPAKRDALRDRMASEPQPDIGAGMEGSGSGDAYQDQIRSTAAAIVRAGKMRRGEKL